MNKIIIITVLALTLTGCNNVTNDDLNYVEKQLKIINAELNDIKTKLDSGVLSTFEQSLLIERQEKLIEQQQSLLDRQDNDD